MAGNFLQEYFVRSFYRILWYIVAYCDEIISRTQAFEYLERFKEGREDMNDEQYGWSKCTVTHKNVWRVNWLFWINRRISVKLMVEHLNMSEGINFHG